MSEIVLIPIGRGVAKQTQSEIKVVEYERTKVAVELLNAGLE